MSVSYSLGMDGLHGTAWLQSLKIIVLRTGLEFWVGPLGTNGVINDTICFHEKLGRKTVLAGDDGGGY